MRHSFYRPTLRVPVPTRLRADFEADLAAIPAWWAAQHAAAAAARAAGAAPPGWVFPPDAFDVTVTPDEDVQVAVDACPPGGSVLLLPGTHNGPLDLPAGKRCTCSGAARPRYALPMATSSSATRPRRP